MKTTFARAVCPLCLIAMGGLIGCGHSDRSAVHGMVLLDGRPIAQGTISFVCLGQSSTTRADQAAWAEIKDGGYQIPAATGPRIGTNRVEIHATHKTGRKSPLLPDLDEYAETIPDRYHARSELSVNVTSGDNAFDFQLEKGNVHP